MDGTGRVAAGERYHAARDPGLIEKDIDHDA